MDIANGNDGIEKNKIFVGGLAWATNKESLQAYFEKFGTVIDSVVMVDPTNNKPRGFGFITFENQHSVAQVMSQGHHMINNKKVDPKPATQKNSSVQQVVQKIFVGGIPTTATDEEVLEFFSTFGKVKDVDIKLDKETSKKRGFAFVTFMDDEKAAVEEIVMKRHLQFNGKMVECKKAEPRTQGGGRGNIRSNRADGTAMAGAMKGGVTPYPGLETYSYPNQQGYQSNYQQPPYPQTGYHGGYQPPQAGYQGPQGGYQPPHQGGYQAPQGGYQAPQAAGYQAPQAAGYQAPQAAGYQAPQAYQQQSQPPHAQQAAYYGGYQNQPATQYGATATNQSGVPPVQGQQMTGSYGQPGPEAGGYSGHRTSGYTPDAYGRQPGYDYSGSHVPPPQTPPTAPQYRGYSDTQGSANAAYSGQQVQQPTQPQQQMHYS